MEIKDQIFVSKFLSPNTWKLKTKFLSPSLAMALPLGRRNTAFRPLATASATAANGKELLSRKVTVVESWTRSMCPHPVSAYTHTHRSAHHRPAHASAHRSSPQGGGEMAKEDGAVRRGEWRVGEARESKHASGPRKYECTLTETHRRIRGASSADEICAVMRQEPEPDALAVTQLSPLCCPGSRVATPVSYKCQT